MVNVIKKSVVKMCLCKFKRFLHDASDVACSRILIKPTQAVDTTLWSLNERHCSHSRPMKTPIFVSLHCSVYKLNTKTKKWNNESSFFPELRKSCGYAGTAREESLPYLWSLRKV